MPSLPLLERLNKRNEYLISSNHPLKKTIIRQTGKTAQGRLGSYKAYNEAKAKLLHTWEPLVKLTQPSEDEQYEDNCPFANLDPERVLESNEHALSFRDAYPVTELHTGVPKRRVATYSI